MKWERKMNDDLDRKSTGLKGAVRGWRRPTPPAGGLHADRFTLLRLILLHSTIFQVRALMIFPVLDQFKDDLVVYALSLP